MNATRVLAVIPARMGSSRFPGKPLAALRGRPMLEHVYRGTVACDVLDDVVIATCDDAILQAARQFGANAVMTSHTHERATDRVAEVSSRDPAEVVVMVQGDEPMIRPEMVSAAVAPLLADPSLHCTNLAAVIHSREELESPNTIKVVMALNGDALYFTRAPVPAESGATSSRRRYKQVCVMAFRRAALQRFASLPQSPLEISESIDMLRFLENGIPVRLIETVYDTHAVDTPADLALVESLLSGVREPPLGGELR
jgi:3-deoxy-manno-octulosonate cytidylyltransferase (CMP-KDO synthetase)